VRQRAGDTARISPLAAEREVIAGRYELGQLIGRGGMAEVFAGRDRMLERIVAVKRPRRDVDVDAAIGARCAARRSRWRRSIHRTSSRSTTSASRAAASTW